MNWAVENAALYFSFLHIIKVNPRRGIKNMKKAMFTGGGTAGHVTPNIALMAKLRERGYELHYVGTEDGMERALIEKEEGVTYHTISSGKLRRYFSMKNFTDPFRVLKGISQSKKIVKNVRPDVIFSKGGFVSVPLVLGASKLCPVLLHESDYTPGLANRISLPRATKVLTTFEDTAKHVKNGRAVCTGTPIRPTLFKGERERAFAFTGLSNNKPVLLMMGGSQGALAINEALREALDSLLPMFHVVHLCGKGKKDDSYSKPGYLQYEYIGEELPDLLAMADIILSRAGANAIFEFLALKKPALLVPLPSKSSRGDQILNASYFKKRGYADVLMQEDMSAQTLSDAIKALYENRGMYISKMNEAKNTDGTDAVIKEILDAAGDKH